MFWSCQWDSAILHLNHQHCSSVAPSTEVFVWLKLESLRWEKKKNRKMCETVRWDQETEMEKGQAQRGSGDGSSRSQISSQWIERPGQPVVVLSGVGGSQSGDSRWWKSSHSVFILCFFFSCRTPSQAERKADNLHTHRLAHCHWQLANYSLIPTCSETVTAFCEANVWPPTSSLSDSLKH